MAYWLLKTEPNEYSFSDLLNEGTTMWAGVTNSLALKYLRSMKRGDMALIYHTGKEKAIIGSAKIVSAPYMNPDESDERIVVVDVKAIKRLNRAISLGELKSKKEFSSFELVRLPRLSVMPVREGLWNRLMDLGAR